MPGNGEVWICAGMGGLLASSSDWKGKVVILSEGG